MTKQGGFRGPEAALAGDFDDLGRATLRKPGKSSGRPNMRDHRGYRVWDDESACLLQCSGRAPGHVARCAWRTDDRVPSGLTAGGHSRRLAERVVAEEVAELEVFA